MLRFRLLFLAIILASSSAVRAQDLVTFTDSSRVWVDGTSNRSDWTVHAERFEAMLFSDGTQPDSVALTVDVMAMESRKSTIMDRLMQRTLRASMNPSITFRSTDVTAADSAGAWLVTGDLTIAGATRSVSVPVSREDTPDGATWTGAAAIRMTDFDMQPPTAMFGALHTGDEVTVRFRLVEAQP